MRAMDADKVRQEKAQRKADDALMEPARLAARGFSIDQIIKEMQRQGLPVERQYLQRQIEKASRKRVAEEEEPFFAVNKDVSYSSLYWRSVHLASTDFARLMYTEAPIFAVQRHWLLTLCTLCKRRFSMRSASTCQRTS